MPDRKLLLVAGTGRSGTSTFVGVAQRHGFHVPRPEVEADESNPRGFGEPRWVVDLHSRLLRAARVQVADSRPAAWAAAGGAVDGEVRGRVREWLTGHLEVSDRLVVKDPRMLWFLPLWQGVADDLGVATSYVTMLRPAPETVGSRRTYYNRGLEDPHGIASWLNLMAGTEHATRGRPRSVVRYHDLLDDWSPAIDRVWRRNRLGDGPESAPPAPSEDPGDFIDPGLRRMRSTWTDLALPERLGGLAVEAAECLDLLAATPPGVDDDPALLARLDATRSGYADYYAECESVAHSSIVAARTPARSQPRAAPVPGRIPLDPGWPSEPRGRVVEVAGRAAARVPESVRRRVPARWRARLKRAIDRS